MNSLNPLFIRLTSENLAISFFSERMTSKKPIWPNLCSLTGGADVKIDGTIFLCSDMA